MRRIKNKLKRIKNKLKRFLQKQKPVYIPVIDGDYLKDRTALITGGTSGIGLAIAQAFLRCGANVVITGRNKKRIDEAVCMLNDMKHQGYAKGVQLDISKVEDIDTIFKELLESLNGDKIDILVNNAGVLKGNSMGKTTNEDFSLTIDTNLKGTYFLSQTVSNYMIENKIQGNILNVASSSSLRPALSPYVLSKWGIRGLTVGMAKKLIKYDIVVNGIAPGPTFTPMLVKENEKEYIDNPNVPAGRYCTSEEIANLAVVLTSGMGRMVVGDILYVTGGSGVLTYDDIKY